MTKPREFWMDTDILDQALDNCDLGDGYKAKVRQFPHKDMLPQLTHVREVLPIDWEKVWLRYDMSTVKRFNMSLDEENKIQELVEKALKGEL